MKKNHILFCITILLFFLFLPAFSAEDNIIVGGKRVGPILLGDPITNYLDWLGKKSADSKPNFLDFPQRGMMVLVKNGKIEGIMVYSPNYKTQEGVQVGSPVSVLNTKYGNYLKTDAGTLMYSELGLAFNDKDNKISRIMVVSASPDVMLGDKKIVPGVRAGNIKIGMEISLVEQNWGQAKSVVKNEKDERYSEYKYDHKGVTLVVESGIVAAIRINSYKYQTPEGIGMNSTKEQVFKTYGGNYKQVGDSYKYGPMGISFYIHEGKILEVLVIPRTE